MHALDHRPLTLADIGLLAHVQRPVVTVWRSRFAIREHPFPTPIGTIDGQEVFDCEAILSWLEVTGCGNNPEARDDAVAFTMPAAQVTTDDIAFAGLSALLCLRAITGQLASDPDDVLDQAETFDSDDELLFGELEALGSRLEPLARYADLLVAAAFDPAEPFDELVRRRQATTRQPSMAPQLRRLLAATTLAIADEAGIAEPTVVVRSVTDLDLVIETAALAEAHSLVRAAITFSEGDAASAEARLARRWLRVHGIPQVHILDEGDGRYELPDDAVVLLRLPTPDVDRVDSLDAVSNLCLNVSDRHRAIVVGPAATLTDALHLPRRPGRPTAGGSAASPAQLVRRDALRTDRVRAVVRLPSGLLREQPRARAALWCLGPSRCTPASTMCADLSQPLIETRADDLVTDLTAAMQGPRARIAHELTYARFRPTQELSTSAGDLIAPTTRQMPVGPEQAMTPLLDLLDRVTRAVPGIARPGLTALSQPGALSRVTLGEAIRQGSIAWHPGARIESAGLSGIGEVPVVRSALDLDRCDQLTELRLIELAAAYPHVELTQPGDIVVSTAQGTAARVDHVGGAVVAYPARVLRCHRPPETTLEERQRLTDRGEHPQELADQTFVPESVAADINAQPRDTTSWKAWPLTVLPTAQIAPIETVLSDVADRRSQLQLALTDLDVFVRTLTKAVGAQVCAVTDDGTLTDTTTTTVATSRAVERTSR